MTALCFFTAVVIQLDPKWWGLGQDSVRGLCRLKGPPLSVAPTIHLLSSGVVGTDWEEVTQQPLLELSLK